MCIMEDNRPCSNKYKGECPCTYPCENHGRCCDCVAHHREYGGIVACLKKNK